MTRDSERDTGAIAQELARLQRRAVRQKRSITSGSDAWRKWSVTMDEIARLTQGLVVRPANDLESLAAKFEAILWLIEINQNLLDSQDLRRLRRFGRDLVLLTGGET
jgi:hypothetical protein